MLFRIHVSKVAARKGRAILEGVGLPTEVRETCYANHPSDVEEAVQSGLIKWRNGGGSSPTWTVLLNAMEYAEIGVQNIRKLKKEIIKGTVFNNSSCSSEALDVYVFYMNQCIPQMLNLIHTVTNR